MIEGGSRLAQGGDGRCTVNCAGAGRPLRGQPGLHGGIAGDQEFSLPEIHRAGGHIAFRASRGPGSGVATGGAGRRRLAVESGNIHIHDWRPFRWLDRVGDHSGFQLAVSKGMWRSGCNGGSDRAAIAGKRRGRRWSDTRQPCQSWGKEVVQSEPAAS